MWGLGQTLACMFDLATQPQPNRANVAVLAGVPFDWRLLAPAPARAYPWTDYSDPYTGPASYAQMLETYALAMEDTLATAVVLSLFTDRRASRDDALPTNQTDRRGWVGEEFVAADFDTRPDNWGSALWLLPGKATLDVLEQARFAAQEALAWLVRDGIASRVEVTAEWVGERGDRLAVRPTIYQPNQTQPVYDVLWGTSIRRWASA
jgi:phage gp46-like protein